MKNFILTLSVFAALPVWGQIQLDNQFEDWSAIPHSTSTDGGPFVAAAVTSNADWLYLHIEVVEEVALDENALPNDYRILLDLDDDPATGVDYASQGLGVDLLINLATRQAIRYTNGSGIESFNEIGMRAAPTYSGNEFELAFDRGLTQVAGDGVRVKWYDNADQVGFPEKMAFTHAARCAGFLRSCEHRPTARNAQPGRLLERQQSDG